MLEGGAIMAILGEIVIELLSKENRIMFLSMKTIRFPDF